MFILVLFDKLQFFKLNVNAPCNKEKQFTLYIRKGYIYILEKGEITTV